MPDLTPSGRRGRVFLLNPKDEIPHPGFRGRIAIGDGHVTVTEAEFVYAEGSGSSWEECPAVSIPWHRIDQIEWDG